MLRAHSMRSRRSKSFRFLQIISAANKQYTGARVPDRQQAAALAACIPLRCFCRFAVFYAAACIPFRRFAAFYAAACIPLRCFAAFAAFSAALAYSDIAAVCCDSHIVRWQDGIAPYTISFRLAALAASLNCRSAALAIVSIKFPSGLYFALFLFATFPEKIDTFL